jgi:hypothetical protein
MATKSTETKAAEILNGEDQKVPAATLARINKAVAGKTLEELMVPPPTAMKPAAPKTTNKVERIPAETFVAELKRLGLSKSQAAKALGVSPSSITEYSGGGRHNLLAKSRWVEVKAALAKFAKGIK